MLQYAMATMSMTFGQDLTLDFDLDPNPIAELWLAKMRQRDRWPLDDAKRFYGFDSLDQSRHDAEQRLRRCINIINGHERIIQRECTGIDDQDFLNYLHNIFEKYHGLLDQQNTDWWHRAPREVQQALADLNINVHRAESVSRTNLPRLTCTWFGMPKDTQLEPNMMIQHGRISYEFGGVYLNYVEIGKTLEDLAHDNDQYIGEDAFKPFLHYSADFTVRFYDAIADVARIYKYFEAHRDFFTSRGIQTFDDYRTMPRRYKVAQLRGCDDRTELLAALRSRQHVTDIYIA